MEKQKKIKYFYESVRRTLFTCRIAGYLPVSGLMNDNSKLSRLLLTIEDAMEGKTKCVWVSPYTIYYVVNFILLFGGTCIHYYDVFNTDGTFRDIAGLMHQTLAFLSLSCLIILSINWNKFVKHIEDKERLLPPLKNPKYVCCKINLFIIILLSCALADHLIHVTYTVRVVIICFSSLTNEEFTPNIYYTSYYRWFFDYVPYNNGFAVLIQLLNLQTMFLNVFTDTLVIVVTLYLVYRFRYFDQLMKVRITKCKYNNHTLWMDLQAHYTRLAALVKIIDNHINPFVFLSFLSNLVNICKKIYHIVQRQQSNAFINYNPECDFVTSCDWVSVLEVLATTFFLFFRTLTVSGLSSYLYSLSREPLNALHTVPASAYNLELQRFMDQVFHSKVTLSGMGFFYVTQATILLMLSTIVTYELVLLQLPVIYS